MRRLCGAAVLVLAPVLALALTLSGCNQSANAPASAAKGPGTANVGPAVASAPAPASAAPSSPACKSGDLTLSRISEDAGAGHRVVTYGVVNNSHAACSLTGYPTLTLIDTDGRRTDAVTVVATDQAFYNVGGPPQAVNLTPGGKAVFFLSFAGIQATEKPCTAISRLIVIPPGNNQAIELADTLQVCTGEVRLSPIRPNQGALTSGGGTGSGPVFY
jgi:hypothetical protein